MVDRGQVLRAAGFDLPDDGLDALLAVGRDRRLDKGEYLFHKGDRTDSLLVILDGRLQAVSTSFEGQDLVFGEFERAAVIGELTVIDGAPRSASVRAVTPAHLVAFPRDAFLERARVDPDLGLALALLCAHRARRLSTWAEGASFADTTGRLVAVLVEACDALEADGPVKLKATQQTLADRLGVTRESVNKSLRSLEGEGLVGLGRGTVTVHDLDELRWRVVA